MSSEPGTARIADELAGLAGGFAAMLLPFATMAFGGLGLPALVFVPLIAVALVLAAVAAVIAAPLLAARAAFALLRDRRAPARTGAPAPHAAGSPACGRSR